MSSSSVRLGAIETSCVLDRNPFPVPSIAFIGSPKKSPPKKLSFVKWLGADCL